MATNNSINNIYRAGRLTGGQVYTSSTTWSKPAGMKDDDFILIEGVGGGGGSNGTPATNSTNGAVSGSGAGGGYFFKKILGSALASSETITIGAGGAAGAPGGLGAGDGGTTSFGAHASATGGEAANIGGVVNSNQGTRYISASIGGIGAGGDINITGARSVRGLMFFNEFSLRVSDIRGGGSALSSSHSSRGGSSGGIFPGGGAYGTAVGSNSAARPGAAGATGMVKIAEYY